VVCLYIYRHLLPSPSGGDGRSMTSSDGEERLLQHISQQLTREMHVARSHHSHVSVITVGGRDVLGGRSPVHVRHPKPTRHHEGYASGPMLDGVLATGLHSGEALRLLHPKGTRKATSATRTVLSCANFVFGARTSQSKQNKLNLLCWACWARTLSSFLSFRSPTLSCVSVLRHAVCPVCPRAHP